MYRIPLWRHFDGNDGTNGGGGGGAPAGQPAAGGTAVATPPAPPASPAQPPAPQPPAQLDPQAYQALVVQNARLQARVEFPQADVDLINTLTDPAAISAVAKRTHELALAARSQGQQTPGIPVPSDNATRAAESEEARRVRELQYKVRQRMRPGYRGGRTVLEPWEAEDARDLFFKYSWNGHMEHRRLGRGNVSAPPNGAPPAPVQAPVLPAPGRAF